MRDAIAWSYDLLGPAEQRVFRQLSSFRGSFSLDAAEAVWDRATRERMPPVDSLFDGVASLVDNSLLRREERGDEPRYRMLETVRAFGHEQLAALGELAGARRAHAHAFLALAERAAPEWYGSRPATWLDRLEADHDNLRAALGWAVEQPEAEMGCRLAVALHWLWRVRGPVSEGRRWMEAILATSEGLSPDLRASLLNRAGDLAMVQGNLPGASSLHERSLVLAERSTDRSVLTWSHGFLGLTAFHLGDLALAEHHLERAVALAQEAGPPAWIPAALPILASVARRRGDHHRAVALVEEALAFSRAHEMAWYVATILTHAGDEAVDRNELPRAEASYRDALSRLLALGERREVAGALAGFAWTAALRGDAERAARYCGAVEAVLELFGVNLVHGGQLRYERALDAAQASLDPAAFAAARATGRGLQPDHVLNDVDQLSASDTHDHPGTRVTLQNSLGLTEREMAVLHLLAERRTDREIAEALFVGSRTVQSHVAHILTKLGVANRREAADEARRLGLV